MALEQPAPGRLRLGVGPSHASIVGGIYGLPFERPQAHLREYIGILRAVLETDRVDFDGDLLSAHGQISAPTPVPILAGARGLVELHDGADLDAAAWATEGTWAAHWAAAARVGTSTMS